MNSSGVFSDGHGSACMSTCICIYIYIYINTCAHYICIHACICTHVRIIAHITYIYIHTQVCSTCVCKHTLRVYLHTHACRHRICASIFKVCVWWPLRKLSQSFPYRAFMKSLASNISSTSTLDDAQQTLSQRRWAQMTGLDRSAMQNELAKLKVRWSDMCMYVYTTL